MDVAALLVSLSKLSLNPIVKVSQFAQNIEPSTAEENQKFPATM